MLDVSTCWSRSPRASATSTRSTTRPVASAWTGCCSPRRPTPSDYGFIENTLGQDGDPLDALVILQAADLPGLPHRVPRDRHVPHDRRGRRRRQGPVRPDATTRAWSTCATSTTSPSSTASRSSTSSRSTRTSSPASPSRAPTGSAASRPRPRSAPRSSGPRPRATATTSTTSPTTASARTSELRRHSRARSTSVVHRRQLVRVADDVAPRDQAVLDVNVATASSSPSSSRRSAGEPLTGRSRRAVEAWSTPARKRSTFSAPRIGRSAA